MSHQEDIKALIVAHNRRLQILKKQRATQGVSTEPKIIIEIEDIEADLVKLHTELKKTEDAEPSSLQVESSKSSEVDKKSPSDAAGEDTNKYYSCFISYAHQDEAFAQQLYDDLQRKKVQCWFAPEDMRIGAKMRVALDQGVLAHHKLLLILSEHSIASDWVEQEVETALEKEREDKGPVLFPIRLDDKVKETKLGWAAHIRRTRHIGDFSRWQDSDAYQASLKRLLRDLTMGES